MIYKYVKYKTWADPLDINSKYLHVYSVVEKAWISPSAQGLECGLETEELLFDSRLERRISFFSERSKGAVGPIQSPILRIQGISSSGVKRSQRESDHSPQSLVEIFLHSSAHLMASKVIRYFLQRNCQIQWITAPVCNRWISREKFLFSWIKNIYQIFEQNTLLESQDSVHIHKLLFEFEF